jgi:hypothetical protein
MNVLFDDGISFDRKLRYEDKRRNKADEYWGRYDRFSEAFSFFQPIDNVWGDFFARDLEEIEVSGGSKPKKLEFKSKYYLRRIINKNTLPIAKGVNVDWKTLVGDTVDIARLFPKNEEIFENEDVIGVAFDIYKRETFIDEDKCNLNVVDSIRHKATTYFLDVRLVVKKPIEKAKYESIKDNKIEVIQLTRIITEKWSPREDLLKPDDDTQNLFRVAPTLVLNKETIINNRNYNGDWNSEPKNWDKNEIENSANWDSEYLKDDIDTGFKRDLYWDVKDGTSKMVVRIGRINERYYLFLHGDHESHNPIRIPSN